MNFEDNIKDRLESRRIEPTASAWDRIEGKLEVAKGKKKSKVVLWTGIAASFITGVFITMLLFNSSSQDIEGDFVVTPQVEKTIKEIEKTTNTTAIKKQNEAVTTTVNETVLTSVEEKLETTVSPAINKKTVHKKPRTTITNTQIAVANTILNDKVVESKVLEETIETSVDKKINEVVASVDLDTVTDQEVDVLLAKAHREIISTRIFNTKTNTVNANALLLDAESEVDPDTFKDKVFKTLKTGFDKAVEAVATRDN